jgi:hypothetical protein
MDKIRKLRAKIGEFSSALEKMNEQATPETALNVKVANEVFGEMLAKMQAELAEAEAELAEEWADIARDNSFDEACLQADIRSDD